MDEIAELRASRARLVAAADAERRRIERDLHDGPQQQFVALAVNLQLARQLADTDLAALRRLLDELSVDVRAALDEVRALAQSVYPPLLRERGLAESLAGAGAVVEGAPAERPALEVEATVYFCCLAALDGAERGAVRLWAKDGELRFEVSPAGGDLTDARDRVAALGGRLEISGDRLSGAVPA